MSSASDPGGDEVGSWRLVPGCVPLIRHETWTRSGCAFFAPKRRSVPGQEGRTEPHRPSPNIQSIQALTALCWGNALPGRALRHRPPKPKATGSNPVTRVLYSPFQARIRRVHLPRNRRTPPVHLRDVRVGLRSRDVLLALSSARLRRVDEARSERPRENAAADELLRVRIPLQLAEADRAAFAEAARESGLPLSRWIRRADRSARPQAANASGIIMEG